MSELVPRVAALMRLAKRYDIGFAIDAEDVVVGRPLDGEDVVLARGQARLSAFAVDVYQSDHRASGIVFHRLAADVGGHEAGRPVCAGARSLNAEKSEHWRQPPERGASTEVNVDQEQLSARELRELLDVREDRLIGR